MFQLKSSAILALVALATVSSVANAHGILTDPPARAPQSEANITKFQPRPPTAAQLNGCFGGVRGATTRTFQAGSEVEIKWAVPIPHPSDPGVSIAIQYNEGEPFESLLTGANASALSATVTLPAGKTSDTAVIQWVWDTVADNGFYAACGDVKVE